MTALLVDRHKRGRLRHRGVESTNIDGITRIHYEIPRLGRNGKPDGTYKAISSPKTVYDPIKFSDHEMLEMGQKAVAKGYSDLLERNRLDPKAYQDSQKITVYNFTTI